MNKAQAWAGVLVVACLLLGANTAGAAPRNGFAVFGGVASHSATGKGTAGVVTGVPIEYSSSGLSVGIDYQIALGESFSINPFLMSSSESTRGDLTPGVRASHGILGLELRLWPGDFFLGVHAGSYSEVLTTPTGGSANVSLSARGSGGGVSAGWESPTGGIFGVAQVDSFSLAYSDLDIKETALRVQIGFRWK